MVDLSPGTLQAIADPHMTAAMYHQLLCERNALAEQLSQHQYNAIPELTSHNTRASTIESLVTGLRQLQELAAALGQAVADILSSTSSPAANALTGTIRAGAVEAGLEARSSTAHLYNAVVSRSQVSDGSQLLTWGSGISGRSATSREPSTVGASQPAAPTVGRNPANSEQPAPPEAASAVLNPLVGGDMSLDGTGLAVWGSGAWITGTGGRSPGDAGSGGTDLATVRLPSRLAVSSGAQQLSQNALLEPWGSGITPRWRSHSSSDHSSQAHGHDSVDRNQALAAAAAQVQQLQVERQQLEQLCEDLQQRLLQCHQSAQDQQHILVHSEETIRRMQWLAETFATLRTPGLSPANSAGPL